MAHEVLKVMGMTPPQGPKDPNQGEGDRASMRRYNERVREFVERGEPGRAARDARDDVERDPEDAARAERKAARRGTVRPVDEIVGMARTFVERVKQRIAVLRERYHKK
jgi:hypothetical protein